MNLQCILAASSPKMVAGYAFSTTNGVTTAGGLFSSAGLGFPSASLTVTRLFSDAVSSEVWASAVLVMFWSNAGEEALKADAPISACNDESLLGIP